MFYNSPRQLITSTGTRLTPMGVDVALRLCLRCVYLRRGTDPAEGGAWCQRISQTPFDSRERLYLNKATILRENPANLLIPISVSGLGDSRIRLICFFSAMLLDFWRQSNSVRLSVCPSVSTLTIT